MFIGANVICGFIQHGQDQATADRFRRALNRFCQRLGLEARIADLHPAVEAYRLSREGTASYQAPDDLLLAGTACTADRQGAYAMAQVSRTADAPPRLQLQRDPLGIGSLYSLQRNHSVCFSSSLNFLAMLLDRPALDARALVESLCLATMQPNLTWFEEIDAVPAGRALSIELEGDTPRAVTTSPIVPTFPEDAQSETTATDNTTKISIQNAQPLDWEEFYLELPDLVSYCNQPGDFRLEAFLLKQSEDCQDGLIECDLGLRPSTGKAPVLGPVAQAAYPLLARTLKKRVSPRAHIAQCLKPYHEPSGGSKLHFDLFARWPAMLNRIWEIAQLKGQHWLFPRFADEIARYRQQLLDNKATTAFELDLPPHAELPQPKTDTTSCINAFDAAQRLYRMGRDKNLSNRLFRLQPPVTAKLARKHERLPEQQYGDLALRLVTADHLLRRGNFTFSHNTERAGSETPGIPGSAFFESTTGSMKEPS